jgi:coproporphyrinogen III oxidase
MHPQQTHIEQMEQYLRQLQDTICDSLQGLETETTFTKNAWGEAAKNHGRTCVIENGTTLEKGGVNFSHIYGTHRAESTALRRSELSGQPFQALGLSLVIHPRNPFIPTSHFNIRFFITEPEGQAPVWWFGGGFDLTPYYGFEEDVIHWHQTAHKACQNFGHDVYPRFKSWCDQYFYLTHRDEARGVGGLFFDDLNEWPFEKCFQFMQSVGNHYLPAYLPLIEKRKNHPFTDQHRAFQAYRRGRYVEFNLLQDRGTRFGLQANGRTEAILMSLPPVAHWQYDWTPKPGSKEAELYEKFLPVRDWLK